MVSLEYIEKTIKEVKENNKGEIEFIQAVEELLPSLKPILDKNPNYIKENVLARLVEPERQIMFKVSWTDDEGNIHVNRGYRIQFNGAIGPYKGGIRFHPSVNLSIMKFLALEQTIKNGLTGLPLGGAKGGADFDPSGKSDAEILRFTKSYMTELHRHIGPDMDVPAGDIGVGKREIGYLYGHYRRIKGSFENGVITGKGLSYGGSLIRPEATGYGIVYFINEILKNHNDNLKEKRVAVSGFGNVAWGVCKKLAEFGAKVVTLSGPDGYILDEDGINTKEKFDYIVEMRNSCRNKIADYADKFNVPFYPNEKPWCEKVDIIIPCATENEIKLTDAKKILQNKVKYVCEGSNMPMTNEALKYLQQNKVIVGPSKAANAGGVSVSALEMSQNSLKLAWTEEEVDLRLREIMINIHNNSMNAAKEYGYGYDLVSGANIVGFERISKAMIAQGDY